MTTSSSSSDHSTDADAAPDECGRCYSTAVVPVCDKRIERSPLPGNRFRRYCTRCDSWLTFTSKAAFKSHARPHVLPADADPDDPDAVVPIDQYDYADEWNDLRERAGLDRRQPDDGDDDADAVQADAQDAAADPPRNEFDCPNCETHVTGFPDACPDCSQSYDWPDSVPRDSE